LTGNPDSLVWVVAALSLPTEPEEGVAFSGEATVLDATVLDSLLNITLVHAGPLPPQGGSDIETLLSLNVPVLLTSKTASASTVGAGNQSNSQATVENLSLNVLNLVKVSATVIDAMATAKCNNGSASVSGGSLITHLQINGSYITVTGEPNQRISLPLLGVTIIINEQSKVLTSNTGDVDVNALHIIVEDPLGLDLDIADVRISHAHADINCGN
jgi:hypothetical protein